MMQPRNNNRKSFKMRSFRKQTKDSGLLDIGEYGLKVLEGSVFTNKQMETLKANVLRKLKKLDKTVKVYLKVFPHISISKKPAETRMGSGKGPIELWGCKVEPGKVILEVVISEKISSLEVKCILEASGNKLPFKTKFVEAII
ncbi:50S ribosomal protein L16 [Rickettsiales bacterium (ex Bugula neritina AB1)]|nr:50S ribosomal protein L16 [Rickettsiales bacterium (ex Bugula neritina AB1)]